MNCWKLFALLLAIVVIGGVLIGCGEKAPSEKTGKSGEADWAAHQRESREVKIPPEIMDSLRVKKRRYQITRDAYWDDVGGVLENSFLELWYPPGSLTVTHGVHAFEQIVLAREKFRLFFGKYPKEKLKVICTAEMEDFNKMTNLEWWQYSEIKGDQITFQPIYILYQRTLLVIAVAHEYYRWAIGKLSKHNAPKWLEEGLASYLSGEQHILKAQLKEYADQKIKLTPEEVEEALKRKSGRGPSRIAYYNAYRMVERLISIFGGEHLKRVVIRLGDGVELKSLVQKEFGMPYEKVLAEATDFEIEM